MAFEKLEISFSPLKFVNKLSRKAHTLVNGCHNNVACSNRLNVEDDIK
jgi:hypothetical protein